MRTRVTRVRTHQNMFVEGWGELKNTLPAPSKTFSGLLMTREVEGVEVSAPGKPSFIVPWGNIAVAELAEEPKSVAKLSENIKSQAV